MIKSNSFKRNLSPPRLLPSVLSSLDRRSNRRSRERRWTTGLERGQLPISLREDSLVVDDTAAVALSQEAANGLSAVSLTSWGSTVSDFDVNSSSSDLPPIRPVSPTPDHFSQQDVLQELMHLSKSVIPDSVSNHQYQLSYELAVDNSPLSPSTYGISSQQVTHCLYVIKELLTTERKYILELTEIIEGYYVPLNAKVGYLSLTDQDISRLFGNIEEIISLHKNLFETLQLCGYDYKKFGQCFIDKAEDFKIYTQYCNNYPQLVRTLSKLSTDKAISRFMKLCQQRLNHMLPLGAYLLKPVQRILKYSLLLQELVRHMNSSDIGYTEMQMAVGHMTMVAEHINEMKKKYDTAVYTQEVQSLLSGWEGPELTTYGDIVLKDSFRVMLSKFGSLRPTSLKEAYVLLFQRLILILKKKDEDYQYKYRVEVADAQLTEHLKDPTCFQIRQISSKSTLTFQAKTIEQKRQWSDSIKRLLMESLPGLPDKARQLIMAGFTTSDIHGFHDASKSLHDASKSLTLDRKHYKRDERSESPSKAPPKHVTLTSAERKHILPNKIPVKPTLSLIQAGLGTGFIIGSASSQASTAGNAAKKESSVPESPSEAKRKGKHRYATLPAEIPWTRSDSDPNLLEGHDKRIRDLQENKIAPSSLQSSPLPRVHVVTHLERTDFVPNAPSPVPAADAISLNVPEHESSSSNNVRSSVSSPNLHGQLEEALAQHKQDLLNQETLNRHSNVSPTLHSISQQNEQVVHMRSKSFPLREPTLETIQSVDNTPRCSIIESDIDRAVLPSSSLRIVQTVPDPFDDNDIIHLESRLVELTSNHGDSASSSEGEGEELILDPPNLFGPESVSQYTLDTNGPQQQQQETDKNELLFSQLMNTSPEACLQYSDYDQATTVEEATLNEVLSQPQEDIEELTPKQQEEFVINIEPPSEFQGSKNQSPISLSPDEQTSVPLVSSDNIGLFVTRDYKRQTTPYTSIEDLPSVSTTDNVSPTTPTNPSETSSNLEDEVFREFVASADSNAGSVKRWHSFHGENRIKRATTDIRIAAHSDVSPPKKDKRDKGASSSSSKAESATKLGFLRNRSFGKSHTTARPISLVGLVHSTRDDSDLVDLCDAIEMNRRHRVQTPPAFEIGPSLSDVQKEDSSSPTSSSTNTTALSPKMDFLENTFPPPAMSTPEPPSTSSAIDQCPSSPLAKKVNRWSQLRSKLSSSRSQEATTSDSSSTPDPATHMRIHSEPQTQPRLPVGEEGEEREEPVSLFNVESTDTRRRKTSKDKRRVTSGSAGTSRGKAGPGDNSGNEVVTGGSSSVKRRSRVHHLAREYSRRIKDRGNHPVPPPEDERDWNSESNNTSQMSTSQMSTSQVSTTTTSSSIDTDSASGPKWIRALRERRRHRSQTLGSTSSNTAGGEGEQESIRTAAGDKNGESDLNEDRLSPLSTNFELPTFDSPPLTPLADTSIVPSQSFTGHARSNLSSPDSVLLLQQQQSDDDPFALHAKSPHSNLQRFSSERILNKGEESLKSEAVSSRTSRRSKRGSGWVKSLVSRFNSNK